jgi:enterochelin esterase family protein
METEAASDVLSPRLREVRERVEAGDRDALTEFWGQVDSVGTPLVEPIEDDPNCALVTFLWRATEPVEWVEVAASFGVNNGGSRLLYLPDTDILYHTYRLEYDLRGLYKLTVKHAGCAYPETVLDPHNPKVYTMTFADETGWSDSIAELPGAPLQPWIEWNPDVTAGVVSEHRIDSAILGNSRRLWLYLPPGYDPLGDPYPLVVLLDGESYVSAGRAPETLDNLIAAGQLLPAVCVMVSNVKEDPGARMREFGCSGDFNAFLSTELIGWIRAHAHVTSDPRYVVIGGSSMGGLASAYAGLRLPKLFGNVLSQSGSFWWRPRGDREHEWLARQFVAALPVPVRYYLEVGRLETHQTPGIGPTQVIANRHLRNVLQARGYSLTYGENNGGHNFLSWRGTLADGLIALLGHPGADMNLADDGE